jgi:hypothetical protein
MLILLGGLNTAHFSRKKPDSQGLSGFHKLNR